MNAQFGGPPAGWYPDPKMANTKRYWDATSRTDQVAPMHSANDEGWIACWQASCRSAGCSSAR